eukprot:7101138-Lingulodinium_polyedra.AAC.1
MECPNVRFASRHGAAKMLLGRCLVAALVLLGYCSRAAWELLRARLRCCLGAAWVLLWCC